MAYRQPAPYAQHDNYGQQPGSAPLSPPSEYREEYGQNPYARPGTAGGYEGSRDQSYGPQSGRRNDRVPYRAGHHQKNDGYGQSYGQASDQGYGQGQQDWNNGYGQQNQAEHYNPYGEQNPYAGHANDPYTRPATSHDSGHRPPPPQRSFTDNIQKDHPSRVPRTNALESPTSPQNGTWDNPFPAFNGNGPTGPPRAATSASQRSHGSDRSRPAPAQYDSQGRPRPSLDSGRQTSDQSGYVSNDGRQSEEVSYDRSKKCDRSRPGPGQQFGPPKNSASPSNGNNMTLPMRGADQYQNGPNNHDPYAQDFSPPARSQTGLNNNDPYAQDFSPPARAQTFAGHDNSYQNNGYGNGNGYRQPEHQASHAPQASYGDVFDSYLDEPPTGHGGDGYDSHQGRSPGESDMPNFAAADHSAGDKALHLDANDSNARGRMDRRGPHDDFAGAAHRSRSQPNLRQPPEQNGYGYPQEAPPMPNQRPGYGPPGPNANGRGPPPPNGRMRDPRGQHPRFNGPNGGPAPPGPNGRGSPRGHGTPGPGGRGGPRGPPGSGGPGRPGGPNSRGPPRGGPNGPAGPPGSRGPASPPNGQPMNPDALPEHPAPVRPGLMQQNGAPKQAGPAPVRNHALPPPRVPPAQNTPVVNEPPPPDGYRPVSKAELDSLRRKLEANPSDQATDLILAQKLLEAATVLADEGGRADKRTTAKNRDRYIADSHRIVKKLVSRGRADAMFFLADCHGSGVMGLVKDPKEAFNLYQSAAKLNHAQAAYRVAVCCELGQDEGGGTRRDPLKAVQWYKRAATLGDGPAQYKIGIILLKGLLGQPPSIRDAVSWLKRAAEQADADNPHALHELGLLYESATGNDMLVRDEGYAFDLFMKAADLGYKFSQHRIGAAYEFGTLGCPIDARMSITWYSKAAKQEEHQSELALSGWYLTGTEGIIQQSDTEAYLWARKAATAGLPKAEYAMAYFTETGIGCPADIEAAKRWYWKSASQNFPKAKERLEDLRKGGAKMTKTRVSRSAINKNDPDCIVM